MSAQQQEDGKEQPGDEVQDLLLPVSPPAASARAQSLSAQRKILPSVAAESFTKPKLNPLRPRAHTTMAVPGMVEEAAVMDGRALYTSHRNSDKLTHINMAATVVGAVQSEGEESQIITTQNVEKKLSSFIRHGSYHSGLTDAELAAVHVRGIGGTTEEPGRYENEAELRTVFERFGPVKHITVRHRTNDNTGSNTSWAIVKFQQKDGADQALRSGLADKIKPRGCSHGPFKVTRYSENQANASTGGMKSRRPEMERTLSVDVNSTREAERPSPSPPNSIAKKWRKTRHVTIHARAELSDQLRELRALIGCKSGHLV